MRVAEVETDARDRGVEIPLDHRNQRLGGRQIVGNDLQPDPNSQSFGEAADFVGAAERRRLVVVARVTPVRRRAEMHDQHVERNPCRDLQRGFCFADSLVTAAAVGERVRETFPPLAVRQTRRYRRVHAAQHQSRLEEPLTQLSDCRVVVIVEMASRCEELDRLEAERRNFSEMIATEPLVVVQVRTDTETHTYSWRNPLLKKKTTQRNKER